ncbi:MAG: hypothetical protein M0P69_18750 [Bacteroidales bacterium]|nr:hypothetical protein [Bacteroidales bacterium]
MTRTPVTCRFCGGRLPLGYSPIVLREGKETVLRLYLHRDCFKRACANGETFASLKRKYGHIKPPEAAHGTYDDPNDLSPAFRGFEWACVATLVIIGAWVALAQIWRAL